MYRISVVVPVYNESGNVKELFREIKEVCVKENYTYEIIFVDDGSSDDTAKQCADLKPLKLIRFRRNFGQTAAMDAGIKAAQYDYIVTMDGDRQNDPADIPNMLKYMTENDLDVVSGWRKNRKDTVMKKFTSRGANFLRGIIVKDNIHDSGCSLKVYKRECFENLSLYGEMHRFIPALLKIKGFTVGEIVVNHRPRTAGVTKYNWKRTFKGFVDMISVWFWNKFAVRPLHLLGSTGIISIFIGIVFAIWSLVLFIMGNNMSDYMQPIVSVLFLLAGLFLFVFGLMSDILVKTYYGSKIDTPYNIKEVVENKED
ncbi:MAG: glycosyltransferase family 2 protein [Lachnospiraceae bacterium]|nr:glycosyltransferase family 2 protein [Lachnospiraceae bacterium]MEE0959035.1 glycosyltransferase family 2 protein [Lachnospiraceae bacterium]